MKTYFLYTCKSCLWTSSKVSSVDTDKYTIQGCNACGKISIIMYETDKQVYNKYKDTFLDERTCTIINKLLLDNSTEIITLKAIMRMVLK